MKTLGTGNKPTIYEVLKAKLGREPSNAELCEDVRRILREGMTEIACNLRRAR